MTKNIEHLDLFRRQHLLPGTRPGGGEDRAATETSCVSCRRALTIREVSCGDGQCETCFEKAEAPGLEEFTGGALDNSQGDGPPLIIDEDSRWWS